MYGKNLRHHMKKTDRHYSIKKVKAILQSVFASTILIIKVRKFKIKILLRTVVLLNS